MHPRPRPATVPPPVPFVAHVAGGLAWLALATLVAGALALGGCGRSGTPDDQRVVIRYWEKWTGAEGEAMRAVVDDFNRGQNRIFVEYSTVSQLERKLMLAISGGVPPDVAGIYSNQVAVYAESNALTPLDRFAAQSGVRREQYIDKFWELCNYRDHLWALPATPAANALVWNKKLFRAAGLDPEKPPRTLAELETYNDRLTRRGADGRLELVGHVPAEPGWYSAEWGWWFGGQHWDGKATITADSPENVAAFEWVASYPRRFGANDLLAFRSGFGNFASPQNPFFTGRVAMVLQGPWIYSFIKNYAAPDFEWGVAPFPSALGDALPGVTMLEADLLVVPVGATHSAEGFEFIRYVNSQRPMEKLCLGQRKFTPLRECSPEFFRDHPNPYIGTFLELAKSPNAHFCPQLTTWNIYNNEMGQAFDRVWAGRATPREALGAVQWREQRAFDRRRERWERLAPERLAEWSKP